MSSKEITTGVEPVMYSTNSGQPGKHQPPRFWKSAALTTASFFATEGAAHVGATLLDVAPNPIVNTHSPLLLATGIGLSYIPIGLAQWRTTREAITRHHQQKPTYNELASVAGNLAERRFPDNSRLQTAVQQFVGAAPQLAMEGYYWLGAGVVSLMSDLSHGAATIVGANLGAAGYLNIQTDLSEYHRRSGTVPNKGVMGKLKAVPRATRGILEIKLERNAERLRRAKENVIFRGGGIKA